MATQVAQSAIAEGMVLAEPVINRQGQVLLPAGTALTAKHHIMLKTWGIAHVAIQTAEDGQKPSDGGGMSREVLARAIMRLSKRWQWKPHNAWEKEIYMLAVKRAADLTLKGN
ncbi:MAG: hypothetical protein NTX50_29210 [Candidatus Sumerlaeota bacterium]|nr:hypothetical protein [Candidatus Sumerlaeota bacterium]